MNNITEEEQITSTPVSFSMSQFIPVGMALIGILLGAVSLFVGLSGKKDILGGASDDQWVQLQDRLNRAEMQLVQLSDLCTQNTDQMKSMASQIQQALDNVGKELIKVKSQSSVSHARTGDNISVKSTSAVSSKVAAQKYGTHTIAHNETLSKIAQQYGISVQTLIALNPQANPKRLQVGQKIKVPSN